MKHINGLIFVLAMIVAIAIGAHCQDQDELLKTPVRRNSNRFSCSTKRWLEIEHSGSLPPSVGEGGE
jgi:hypothetical protein